MAENVLVFHSNPTDFYRQFAGFYGKAIYSTHEALTPGVKLPEREVLSSPTSAEVKNKLHLNNSLFPPSLMKRRTKERNVQKFSEEFWYVAPAFFQVLQSLC
jgi:hypothetical protein